MVVGAGNGIGKSTAFRVAKEGAHATARMCRSSSAGDGEGIDSDLSARDWRRVQGDIRLRSGDRAGVYITKRESVKELLKQATLAYGGIDSIVVTAGVYVPPDAAGNLADDKWKFTFDVNVMGLYLVADEAKAPFASQGLRRAAAWC